MATVNAGGGGTSARPGTALSAGSRQQQQQSQQSRKPPLQNGSSSSSSNNNNNNSSSRTQPSPQHRTGQQTPHQRQHQSQNRPRFSPYTPPLSSAVPISSGRSAASARVRHATASTDADADIDDPRIYPTELSSSRGQQEAQASAMSRSYDCTFFSGGASARGHGRRGEFVIHPEWLSESVSIERLRINDRPLITPTGRHQAQAHSQQNYQTQLSHPSHYPNHQQQHQQQQHQLQHQLSLPADWPRRCKSAPPPPQSQHHQAQNPITWQ